MGKREENSISFENNLLGSGFLKVKILILFSTLIVDTKPENVAQNPNNAIIVKKFDMKNKEDHQQSELGYLLIFVDGT